MCNLYWLASLATQAVWLLSFYVHMLILLSLGMTCYLDIQGVNKQ